MCDVVPLCFMFITPHLEDGAHFSELLPRPQEPEGEDRAHVLRYGVEVRDKAVRNLRTQKPNQNIRREFHRNIFGFHPSCCTTFPPHSHLFLTRFHISVRRHVHKGN